MDKWYHFRANYSCHHHPCQVAYGFWSALESIWRSGSTKTLQIIHSLTNPSKDPAPLGSTTPYWKSFNTNLLYSLAQCEAWSGWEAAHFRISLTLKPNHCSSQDPKHVHLMKLLVYKKFCCNRNSHFILILDSDSEYAIIRFYMKHKHQVLQ